jgi:hypothetical protein
MTKFVPVTVSVNWADPAAAEVTLRPFALIVGRLTVNCCVVDDTAEGPVPFWIVTLYVPGSASWLGVAVSVVALPWVVLSPVELPAGSVQYTVEALVKFAPVMVIGSGVDPATAELGLIDVSVTGRTLNATPGEVTAVDPYPFCTMTFTAPTVASWAAVTGTVSCVALTQVVVWLLLAPHITVELPAELPKPVPLIVRVNGALPAVAEVTATELTLSDSIVTPTPNAKPVAEGAVAAPFWTVTVYTPSVAIWALVTVAVR